MAEVNDALEDARIVALAVEMQTRGTYRPRICLLSLCVCKRDGSRAAFCIDARAVLRQPSAQLDRFLARLSACPVVAHGAEYTMAALRRELRVRVRDFVDTQQAAVLLGLPRTGLEALRTSLLELPARVRNTYVWGEGAIGPAEFEHAIGDVRDLPDLHDRLFEMIAEKDLEDEWKVASALIEDPLQPEFIRNANIPDPRRYKQIPGASSLGPEGLKVLSALVQWRDAKAQELDLPSTSLFANAQLIELAQSPDKAPARIADMKFHSRLVHSDRAQLRNLVIYALVEEDAAGPSSRSPETSAVRGEERQDTEAMPNGRRLKKKSTPTASVKARLARLKDWRRGEADRREVGLQAILPAVSMEHLAFFPRTPLVAVPGLGRRRIERYGPVLGALVSR